MVPPTAMNTKIRDRAKIACVHCHARKECDLYFSLPENYLLMISGRYGAISKNKLVGFAAIVKDEINIAGKPS